MHLSPAAAVLCEKYIKLSLLGTPGLFVMLILIGAYRGIGDTMTVLMVSVVVNIIHLSGDFLLIFGSFGAPKLGLPGGAMALVTSQYIGAILYIVLLQRTRSCAGCSEARHGSRSSGRAASSISAYRLPCRTYPASSR